MRVITLTFCGAVIVGTGWKIGTWCGSAFTDVLDAFVEKRAREATKKKMRAVPSA